VLISGWLQGPGTIEAEIDPHVALFRSMDRCFRSIAAWHSRADAHARGERRLARRSDPAAAAKAARLIADAPHASLTEHESKAILGLYGIAGVREIRADGPSSAAAAAATLGYPVALKVESPDIAHKTEAGVVALNVGSASELHQAYERITANARSYAPGAAIHGVIVQSMVPSGIEIVAGARVDPALGPLIVVGFGGILVELLKDSAVELAPINRDEALRMLAKLKGFSLLTGFRGSAPVDLERLADIIVRLSEFVADQQEAVAEVDINPIICGGRSMLAVDALIVRRMPSNLSGAQE
jgi:succinyl-CoA synthetase beta subunit